MKLRTLTAITVAVTLAAAPAADAQWRGRGSGFAFHPGFGSGFRPGFGFHPGFGFRGPCCFNNWWIPGAVVGGLALGAALASPFWWAPPPVYYAPPPVWYGSPQGYVPPQGGYAPSQGYAPPQGYMAPQGLHASSRLHASAGLRAGLLLAPGSTVGADPICAAAAIGARVPSRQGAVRKQPREGNRTSQHQAVNRGRGRGLSLSRPALWREQGRSDQVSVHVSENYYPRTGLRRLSRGCFRQAGSTRSYASAPAT